MHKFILCIVLLMVFHVSLTENYLGLSYRKMRYQMKQTRLTTSLIALCLFFGFNSSAQSISPRELVNLRKMEDSLIVSADSMFSAFIPDMRIAYSERFARQLVHALKIPNSYRYPFDTLRKMINIVYADDNSFRIFNWEIIPGNIPNRYYAALQLPQEKLKLIGLNDYTQQIGNGVEDSVLSGGKWYGALIYRVKSTTVKGQKIYNLFGRNTSGPVSDKKVIDPMYFTKTGVTFGAPIFGIASRNNPQKRVNRFVLEYKKGVSVSMNWSEERQMIVFDKLVSIANDPNRRYTYVPSGVYDGLIWDNEIWNYQHDLIDIKILEDGEAPTE